MPTYIHISLITTVQLTPAYDMIDRHAKGLDSQFPFKIRVTFDRVYVCSIHVKAFTTINYL